jgi:hypothetical protein
MHKLAYTYFLGFALMSGTATAANAPFRAPGPESVLYVVVGGGLLILGLRFGRHKNL